MTIVEAQMHRILVGALLLLPALGAGGAGAVERKAPDFKLRSTEGETIQLQEVLKRGPVYLSFWTTWCKPCQKELPELDKIYQRYRDQGFTLLAISEDDQRTVSRVRPIIRSRKYTFPVLLDTDRRVGNLYGVRNYPTGILIAPDGTIRKVTIGYRKGDEKALEEAIRELLAASAPDSTQAQEAAP
jgi:peroxiredoxin